MRSKSLASLLFVLLAAPSAPLLATAPQAPAAATIRVDDAGLAVRRGDVVLHVSALTASVLRVRITPNGRLPEDASWAVAPEARKQRIKVDPAFLA